MDNTQGAATVEKPSKNGRPAYDDDWYKAMLDEMRPWLVRGNTIRYALRMIGLSQHKDVVYEKYREGKWFADKIDELRSTPGETVNSALIGLVEAIADKVRLNKELSREEIDILKHVSEKHRSAQPFFVSRIETSEAKPDEVGKILDTIENDYAKLGSEAKKQILAPNAPVQNQEQAGGDRDVSSELPANEAPSGQS